MDTQESQKSSGRQDGATLLGSLIDVMQLQGLVSNFARSSGQGMAVLQSSAEVLAHEPCSRPGCPFSAPVPDPKALRPGENDPSAVLRPIVVRGQRVAVLVGCAHAPDGPRPAGHGSLLDALGLAIERWAASEQDVQSLADELVKRYEEINLLYTSSSLLSAELNIGDICRRLIQVVQQALQVRSAAVLLQEGADDALVLAASAGLDNPRDKVPSSGNSQWTAVLQREDPLVIGEAKRTRRPAPTEQLDRGTWPFPRGPVAACALRTSSGSTGIVAIADKSDRSAFTAGDLKLLAAVGHQAAIAIENARFVQELRVAERERRDMEVAAQIQQSLLPSAPPAVRGLAVAGRCLPASRIGGDYFDWMELPDGTLGITIADVSGHSVGAALMTAVTRSVLRSQARLGSPAQSLAQANSLLYPDLDRAGLFVSIVFARYDPNRRELTIANAGHPRPLLWRAGEAQVESIGENGMLLGILPSYEYGNTAFSLQPGDVVLLYTDGLVEAPDAADVPFGPERLEQAFARLAPRGADAVCEGLLHAVQQYVGQGEAQDDLTVVAISVEDASPVP